MSDLTPQPPAAPPPPPPPTAAPTNWRDGIKDEALRNNPFVATAPDFDTFVASAVATKAMTGRKAYDLPQHDWAPEKWKEWNKTIGVPEAPDKYSPTDKAMLEKAGLPPEVMTAAMSKFHEAGLTDRQAKSIIDWYVGDSVKGGELAQTQAAAARVAGENSLKQEFGDKFPAKMGLVKAWMSKNSDPQFIEAVEKSGLGNDPSFVKAIIKSAEATLESDSRTGNVGSLGAGAEVAVAQADIKEIMSRRISDAGYNAKFADPKSSESVRWAQLHTVAYPNKA